MKLYFLCYVILSLFTKQWYEKEKLKAIPQFQMENTRMIPYRPKAVEKIADRPTIKVNIQAHH
jgi:ubiquinone/menaquinone biosynthesis C-methylase UbiE